MPDSQVTLLQGDVAAVLQTLPDASVDCVVTSPPYWGLRDYGTGVWEGGNPECEHEVGGQVADSKAPDAIVAGVRSGVDASLCRRCGATRDDQQLGLERTPLEYVERMVEVFREVRRVLAPHGTCWLNLGDSYSNDTKWGGTTGGKHAAGLHGQTGIGRQKVSSGLKAKDMVGIPWRVALALQEDGWWLRSDIIWSKPNPMPASVRDRPTTSHEYVFLLTKSPRYFFDQDAIREEASWDRWGDQTNEKHAGLAESGASWIKPRSRGELQARSTKRPDGWASHEGSHGSIHRDGREKGAPARLARVKPLVPQVTEDGQGRNGRDSDSFGEYAPFGRNARTVWEIPTQPFPAAHFATFPEELARRCVVAGCAREVCVQCGRPRERITAVSYDDEGRTTNGPRSMERRHLEHGTAGFAQRLVRSSVELGWSDCGCAYGLSPDATELIEAPVSEGGASDPSLETGRAGFDRERVEGEGVRLITRYEQRQYAEQLKASPARPRLEEEIGETTFAHYIRSDRVGARPLPADLLERLIADGTLERVTLPPKIGTTYRRGVVLDPFVGSGTVAVIAKREERDAIGIDLSESYLELARTRLLKWWRQPARSQPPAQMEGQTSMDELLSG